MRQPQLNPTAVASPTAVLSAAAGRFLGLPPALTRRVTLYRDLEVPMRDGVVLRADRYAPDIPAAVPTVLVRTPYGRSGRIRLLCRAVAERGFVVLIQSCRGTFDSAGTFEPLLHERDDGLDTVNWLGEQPWYDGRLVTYGPSYAGIVQWALAADAGTQLKAMSTIVTAAQFADSTYAGGAFSLDSVLTWSALLAAQRASRVPGLAGVRVKLAGLVELLRDQPRLHRGLAQHPLSAADTVATGAEVEFFQRWLVENDPAGEYWAARGHAARLADVGAPALMVGGWYDIFLPWQLDDFQALRAAGASPRLVVGPWTHGSLGLFRYATAESIAWFRHHTGPAAGTPYPGKPVRVYVGGADEWREYDDWPVPSTERRSLHLRAAGGLGFEPAESGWDGDAFSYDPRDPTPALGGPRLVASRAGRRDNRRLEARPDVLTYTTAALEAPVEVIGPVSASIRVRASEPYFDVFVRLCDVDPAGRSWNVCDGLTRVVGQTDNSVKVALWPTAYRFRPGHRIRVQVSGGAHPRFARNPGTGAALGAAGELRPVRLEVLPGSTVQAGAPC